MNGQMISWTRSDLKWRAKQAFRKNYWSAVLVSLVLAIVLASGGKGAAQSGAGNVQLSGQYLSFRWLQFLCRPYVWWIVFSVGTDFCTGRSRSRCCCCTDRDIT